MKGYYRLQDGTIFDNHLDKFSLLSFQYTACGENQNWVIAKHSL